MSTRGSTGSPNRERRFVYDSHSSQPHINKGRGGWSIDAHKVCSDAWLRAHGISNSPMPVGLQQPGRRSELRSQRTLIKLLEQLEKKKEWNQNICKGKIAVSEV